MRDNPKFGRQRRRRRASVLIMVVAMLVLLALAGVAWMVTSRIDRFASVQNVENTQLVMLAEGLRNIQIGMVVDGVFGQSTDSAGKVSGTLFYRPRSDAAAQYSYSSVLGIVRNPIFGALDKRNHPYLAARAPEVDVDGPLWRCISAPPSRGITFESPLNGTTVDPALRYNVSITHVTLNGAPWPALTFRDPVSGAATTLLAADTDGDGIADAALWPLPMAQTSGVKWYAAIRIIDNNSAVNAAVAWQWADTSYAPVGNFFPANVNLQGMLLGNANQQMTNLNTWRFNGPVSASPIPMVADDGVTRADAVFTSPWEQLWSQLGQRLNNPGYNVQGTRFRALTSSDTIALAYRFTLKNPYSTGSTIESLLNESLAAPPGPFPANAASPVWLNHVTGQTSLRTLLVASNANSMQISKVCPNGPNDTDTGIPGGMLALLGEGQPKASLNTAPFDELYRAFWSIMIDKAGASVNTDDPNRKWTTPVEAATAATPIYDSYLNNRFDSSNYASIKEPNPARQFRSVLRDHRTPAGAAIGILRFKPDQVLLLRSALAAINTINLRSAVGRNTSGNYMHDAATGAAPQTIALTAMVGDTPQPVTVTLYGAGKQPFITEVYASTDVKTGAPADPTKTNDKGYVAIELHNPYPHPLPLRNYRIGTVDRSTGYPNMTTAEIGSLGTTATIPPGGYLIIENYSPDDAGTAKYRPASTGLPQSGPASADDSIVSVYMANLADALNKELVISRPRYEGADTPFFDAIPVDQFDFTGLVLPDPTADPMMANIWHYVRASFRSGIPDDNRAWQCVYPGRYDGSLTRLRHQGTAEASWAVDPAAPGGGDPWAAGPTSGPGMSLGTGVAPATTQPANPDASYPQPYPPIQIANKDTAGANGALTNTAPNMFPYGGFARVGDALQIPFIGAYRVVIDGAPANTLAELNSITIDSAFADDGDSANDAGEAVGRFVPSITDLGVDASLWRYQFATKLFDYLTVLAPHDDYLPNVLPARYGYFDTGLAWRGLAAPKPVANADPTRINRTTSPNEDLVGVEGLVNINTAPVKVLSAIPWIPSDPAKNLQLTQAIVDYRAANGPFRTLWDLYRVPGFADGLGTINMSADLEDDQGDLSPAGAGTDGVAGDFENTCAMLIRVSNLLTTRSDSFTCYGIIQGWRDAGTANPKLEVQRRIGFLLDRTNVSPTERHPITVNVPQE